MKAQDGGPSTCVICGPAATGPSTAPDPAAAVADAPDPAPEPPPSSSKVEMSVFGKAVTVEAPAPLEEVSAVALALWDRIADAPAPFGATGFMTGEPSPMEFSGISDPLLRGRRRAS